MSMSDKVDKNLISSSAACELSNSNTVNKMYTPCRRVGLKRKSVSSPIHSNISKKKNLFGHEANENISNESSLVLNAEKQDKSILKIKSTEDFMQDNIKDKQRKIEELKTELKNSEQHNLDKIQELSTKWLSVCHEALMSLFNKLNQDQNSNQYNLKDLITNMGIDPDLIQFDSNNQEFY